MSSLLYEPKKQCRSLFCRTKAPERMDGKTTSSMPKNTKLSINGNCHYLLAPFNFLITSMC